MYVQMMCIKICDELPLYVLGLEFYEGVQLQDLHPLVALGMSVLLSEQ